MTLTHEIVAVQDAPDPHRDEEAAEIEFMVGALAQIDEELLEAGYHQLYLGQAHVSRALDLIRHFHDPETARYLMLANAKLLLQQAQAV